MASVTDNGLVPTGLTRILAQAEQIFRDAFGEDLVLAEETPQGQLSGSLALKITEYEEFLVYVAAGMNIYTSDGKQIDDYASLLRNLRRVARKSVVEVTLGGTAGTVIEAGSRARTTTNSVFALDEDATIGTSGLVTAEMQSLEYGPVTAAVGALSVILDPVTGWDTITNAAAATLGRLLETPSEYREKHQRRIARHAQGSNEAIRSRVLSIEQVTSCLVRDNETNADVTIQSLVIPPNSILAVVQGGDDNLVAQAISDAKPDGIPTTGTTTVNLTHPEGFQIPIRFTKTTALEITVAITTTRRTTFPADGIALIRQRLADWVLGLWTSGQGDFDTTGLQPGENLDAIRLYSPINSVPGHVPSAVVVLQKSTMSALPAVISLNQIITLSIADITVTLA